MRHEKLIDNDYQEFAIESVKREGEHCVITFDGGWCYGGLPKVLPIEPKVGMTMRQYGKRFGSIRGIDIDGVEIFYSTAAEQDAKHRAEVEAGNAKQRADFEKNRESIDARVAALPAVFQMRLDKFRQNNPDFRWQYEGYELFCCEQAVAIADALKTREAIQKFHELPWEKQLKAVPKLSDGHSGNTFGCACSLAVYYLERPEGVVQSHGALAPLVGSEEYGCVPKKGR